MAKNPLPITPQKLDKLLPKLTIFWDELLAKYENTKYSESDYEAAIRRFKTPEHVTGAEIRKFLRWKYGKRRLPRQLETIRRAGEAWDECREKPRTLSQARAFWDGVLPKEAFVSRCFLVHLQFPSLVPLVDQHTWRSLLYLHKLMGDESRRRKAPKTWAHAALVQNLEVTIRERIKLKPKPNLRQIDKFLMMLGKHVLPR